MLYEAGLLWVALSGGYWGVHLLRRGGYASAVYPWMMIAAAVASLLGLIGAGGERGLLDLLGAVGLGAGLCLFLLGPMARRAARLAHRRERWRTAAVAYEVAEVLAPGTGVREEKRLAAAFAQIGAGRSDDAVHALEALRDQAPPSARHNFDEHIVSIYLAAGRWQDAVTRAEALLSPAPRPPLGDLPPTLWIELLGAYDRLGQFSTATSMLLELERELGDNPAATPLVHSARIVHLALCGHVEGTRALLAQEGAPMTPAARHFWLGVAAARTGDHALAQAELRRSAKTSRGRRRRIAEEELGAIPRQQRVELSADDRAVLERVAASPPPPPMPWRRTVFPWVACGTCLLVAAWLSLAGGSTDVGLLVRAGAVVPGLVWDGQWWRLVTAVFLHAGATHLVLNLVSLWVVGRLAEKMFGTLRTAALFCGAGVVGSIVSFSAAQPGVAVGASGAIFGLFGAVLGEIVAHRRRNPAAQSTGLLGAVAVFVIVTLAVGILMPGIDHWAHVGGAAFGLAAGQALTLRRRVGQAAAPAAGLLVAATLGAGAFGAWQAVQLPLAATVFAGPPQRIELDEIDLVAPARWRASEGEAVDPDLAIVLSARLDRGPDAQRGPNSSEYARAWHAQEAARARSRGLAPTGRALTASAAAPAGFSVAELEVAAADPVVGEQRFRALSFVRHVDRGAIVGTLYAPERFFLEGTRELWAILGSVHAR